MNKQNNEARDMYIGLLLFIVFLGAIIFCIYLFLSKLSGKEAATLLAALLAVVGSISSVAYGKYKERKIEIEQVQRTKKMEIYEEFINFWFDLLQGENLGKKMTKREMIKRLKSFTEKVIVWGSDELIKEFGDYRYLIMDPESIKDQRELLNSFENLLFIMRKDLGQKNNKLNQGMLLKLFINDLENEENM